MPHFSNQRSHKVHYSVLCALQETQTSHSAVDEQHEWNKYRQRAEDQTQPQTAEQRASGRALRGNSRLTDRQTDRQTGLLTRD